jgi:hypothetical protein
VASSIATKVDFDAIGSIVWCQDIGYVAICNMWSSIIASKFGCLSKVEVSITTFLLGLLQVHYLLPRSFCVATSWTSYYHIYIRVATSAPYYCHVLFCVATSWTSYYHVSIRVATSAPYYCHVPFWQRKTLVWYDDLSFATYGGFCHAHLCSNTNLKH